MLSANGPRVPSKFTGRTSRVGTLRASDSEVLAGVSFHERATLCDVLFIPSSLSCHSVWTFWQKLLIAIDTGDRAVPEVLGISHFFFLPL